MISVGCAQQITKFSDTLPWSVRIANSFIMRHPDFAAYDSLHPNMKWNYEQGFILYALYQTYLQTKDKKYLNFIIGNLDKYIKDNGEIATYNLEEYNIDNILPGRVVLELYQLTGQNKYRLAADKLRTQLRQHPRTNEGGFWHKKIYPYQMWLDGLYMAQPFSAKYALMFDETEMFEDIANQFLFIARHTFDEKTGLYYHGWDESRQQLWANSETGCSPNFWSRSIGWFMMALIDVLDYFPETYKKRSELVKIFSDLSESILNYRDEKSGLWYQVTDQISKEGNYLEASSSCMFGYSFAKGANKGYLDKKFFNIAEDVFNCVIKEFVRIDDNGFVDLYGTCKSAGLGGKPYRDGSFEYYISEPIRINDMKGIGALILFSLEIEKNKN